MKTVNKSKPSVADYLNTQIDLLSHEKSQMDIAREAGFNKPNIITMLKKGTTKLPLSKVTSMARALRVDAMYLFELCMSEYEPETWTSLEKIFNKQHVLTENELEIIQVIRSAGAVNPKLSSEGDKTRLINFVHTLQSDNGLKETWNAEESERRKNAVKAMAH